MAKKKNERRKDSLKTPNGRKELAPRGKPYADTLLRGVHLEYRRQQRPNICGPWIGAFADGKGERWYEVLGVADDYLEADGIKVLTYEQAADKCRALARGDANAASGKPATVSDALAAYEPDLIGRGKSPYNAKWPRFHLPQHLLAQSLAVVTAQQWRAWRDGLLKGGMNKRTINRMMKGARAAFNLAAKLDKRLRASKGEWEVGLEAFPDTVTAREAVLTLSQVLAVVATSYEISHAFGLYVQTHAETGARSSQLARLKVVDLQPGRLMIPCSKKGRGQRKASRTPVPVTPGLEALLKAAAAGRAANAPLLLRADGTAWKPELGDMRSQFATAAAAAGLPEGTTPYFLRHSSIVRALLHPVPIKVVADWHDTSVAIIEKHYAAFIKDHYDELVRAALIDTTPSACATIVKMRA